MRRQLQDMKIPEYIDRSRIWVGVCAAAMSAEFMLLTGIGFSILTLLQVFFLTWTAYLFLDGKEMVGKKLFISIAATGVVLFVSFSPTYYWWIWIPCAIIVFMYHKNVFGTEKFSLPFDLRSNPFLKTVSIASAWTLLTSVLPAWTQLLDGNFSSVYFIASNFFFVAALSLTEDICDSSNERIPTIATWKGISLTKILATVHMIIACILFFEFESRQLTLVTISFFIVMLLINLFIVSRKPNSKSPWIPLWIDGMFVARFITLFIVSGM